MKYDEMNLLVETIDDLAAHEKTPADVRWIGSAEFGWFTWEDFAAVADETYDAGYGGVHVPMDMRVVGDGWWLERYEYDGAEHWVFRTPPEKPATYRKPAAVIGDDALAVIHGDRDW